GVVNQTEAEFLKDWLESNLVHLEDPVINLLYSRLGAMLADGVLTRDESEDVLSMLHGFAGLSRTKPKAGENAYNAANDLPLCRPAPQLACSGRSFMFTGTMAFAPRRECQRVVAERGGVISASGGRKTHYLMVGSIG